MTSQLPGREGAAGITGTSCGRPCGQRRADTKAGVALGVGAPRCGLHGDEAPEVGLLRSG